jgi:hypothetical protein
MTLLCLPLPEHAHFYDFLFGIDTLASPSTEFASTLRFRPRFIVPADVVASTASCIAFLAFRLPLALALASLAASSSARFNRYLGDTHS